METRYYVCGIGYDENDCVTDYTQDFGDFDTYEEAHEVFVKLQNRNEASFFKRTPDLYQLLIQLEECEEDDDDEINCVDAKNEWWIINPNKENSTAKTWKIPVCWSMMGMVEIEAPTLEEAIEIARDDDGILPLPDDGTYLDGSWEVDNEDVEYLREFYNGNQEDNK